MAILDAPADVLAGRKDEHRIGDLRSLRHAYLALARTDDAPGRGYGSSLRRGWRELTALIWQRYVDRSLKRVVRRR